MHREEADKDKSQQTTKDLVEMPVAKADKLEASSRVLLKAIYRLS
jgi:hypothetical protein